MHPELMVSCRPSQLSTLETICVGSHGVLLLNFRHCDSVLLALLVPSQFFAPWNSDVGCACVLLLSFPQHELVVLVVLVSYVSTFGIVNWCCRLCLCVTFEVSAPWLSAFRCAFVLRLDFRHCDFVFLIVLMSCSLTSTKFSTSTPCFRHVCWWLSLLHLLVHLT